MSKGKLSRVLIAVGTNLGARLANIRAAVAFLRELSDDNFILSSFLYETPPAYVINQPRFLNAVVEIRTKLEPLQLLDVLKEGEENLGRVKNLRFGPRHIDMDILLYNNDVIEIGDDKLTIPHRRMQEREFVLRPLCDLIPNEKHPVLNQKFAELLNKLEHSNDMFNVLPIGCDRSNSLHCSERVWSQKENTRIMGILNVTPDSFSDGGEFDTKEKALEQVKKMITYNVSVIDIGGQSSKPGADLVTVEEEIKRVIPVIRSIRQEDIDVAISVDTYRAEVAKAAVEAGADLINDISGGRLDPAMFNTVAKMGVPIIIMHSRGNPQTMTTMKNYDTVCLDIQKELANSVHQALHAGIPRWNIIIDPGIGFAKGLPQNIKILKNLKTMFFKLNINDSTELDLSSYPVLTGPSRKKFLGTLSAEAKPRVRNSETETETKPRVRNSETETETEIKPRVRDLEIESIPSACERDFGTAAAVTACVASNVSFVRVHNVEAMHDVVAVANAIYN